MLKNHLRTAWRHFHKERTSSFINIFGLALGLVTCIFITLFVVDELSYDRYNVKADRIFRVASDLHINGGSINYVATPSPMAAALVKDFPAIENAVRIRPARRNVAVHIGDKVFSESRSAMADSSLFDIFTLPMIVGDARTALSAPNAVVLSASAAKKYFNNTDVAGRTLRLDEDTAVYVVTGVIRDMPSSSHFHFDLVRSMQHRRQDWINFYSATYILVRPGVGIADIDRMLAQTVDKYIGPQIQEQLHNSMADLRKKGDYFRYYSIPLTDIHLHSNLGGEFEVNGSHRYVVFFSLVAVLVLLMACINFINLSIARSMKRSREIGMRKILGSNRRRLVGQFLVESVLMVVLAMTLAIGVVLVLQPWFNQLSGKHIDASFLLSRWTVFFLLSGALLVGLLSGAYPALVLSGVQPLKILRGHLALGFRTGAMRTALLVFQFSVAMILIIGTGVIHSQLSYIRHRDLGYQREQVLTIKDTRAMGEEVWRFARDIGQMPGVADVTVSGSLPNQKVIMRGFFKDRSGKETSTVLLGDWQIDASYLRTLGMKMVAGRNFSSQLPTDSACVLINETAARILGYVHPIGENIYTGTDEANANRIIGVVKDFNTGSLHDPIDPIVFRLARDGSAVTLRVLPGHVAGVLRSIREKHRSFTGGHPFVYAFLDDDFNKLFESDQRTGRLFTVFSLLAIFIAGMGMFGLVAAAAEQRTREMGIRRVLGARITHLVLLLGKDYGLAIALALIIALPVGAWLMHRWLQGFAYRTTLSWWVFAVAVLTAVFVGLMITGFQALRAARESPVKSLRIDA